jgi:putative spermidine/putrescine transport system permease protein
MNKPRIGLLHRVILLVLFVFLLAPVFPVVAMSFSNDSYLGFPPSSWGFRWYIALTHNASFGRALGVSLVVGSCATLLSIATGLPAAYAIARLPLPGKSLLLALFTAPLVVPTVVLALGLLLVLIRIGLVGTYPGLILAHTVLASPYVVRIVLAGLQTMPADIEAAAATLGARPFAVFRWITLPQLGPALLAAGGLSFLVSFDEVVASLFITGTSISTLPVTIFRYTQDHADPQVAALSTLLIAVSATIILLLERSIGLLRAVGR